MGFLAPAGVRLVRALGAGSVFDVAYVEHGGLRCVCKRLKPGLVGMPAAHGALDREQAVTSETEHAAIPKHVLRGSDERGPFLIQIRADGVPLRSLIGAADDVILGMARAAFAALAEIHALDVVHGDLGIDHVIVSAEGALSFVDYSMSSLRGRGAREGERGTLPYVAPEVARGEILADRAADLYALAATFAHVLHGDPFMDMTPPALLATICDRGLDMARVHATLRAALAFERADRALPSW